MPPRVILWLFLIVIFAAGLTIAAAQWLGLPTALLGLGFAGASLALRLRMDRK
ncbi:hypothetical protein [Pseudorhodobacter sp.]|uniref:hypothetical protein n=1 Tax=Pseudorhodobacter sp. TaxID=1934400 RepID=UPI002AFE9933|nr:hypothetical protein [Pseudorhodobacter sp.]